MVKQVQMNSEIIFNDDRRFTMDTALFSHTVSSFQSVQSISLYSFNYVKKDCNTQSKEQQVSQIRVCELREVEKTIIRQK